MAYKSQMDRRWWLKFQQLKAFYKKNGHCNVGYNKNGPLAVWLWRQRKAYYEMERIKKGGTPSQLVVARLDKERTKLLQSVEFLGTTTNGRNRERKRKRKRAVPRVSVSETETSSVTREQEDDAEDIHMMDDDDEDDDHNSVVTEDEKEYSDGRIVRKKTKKCMEVATAVFVGSKVSVLMEEEGKYYRGVVTKKRDCLSYFVEYDDGEGAWELLKYRDYKLIPHNKRKGHNGKSSEEVLTIGTRVSVYWDGEKTWYDGRIAGTRESTGYKVSLKSGDIEWMELSLKQFRLLSAEVVLKRRRKHTIHDILEKLDTSKNKNKKSSLQW